MTKIIIIAAVNARGVIGKEGTIPWSLPRDLKRFKDLTTGHVVVMGRKTWESLPIKPLPNRMNIIVSTSMSSDINGAIVVRSLNAAIEMTREAGNSCVFLIGGETIYTEGLNLADEMWITAVDNDSVGDAYFPTFDRRKWWQFSSTPSTTENGISYRIHQFSRIKQPPA